MSQEADGRGRPDPSAVRSDRFALRRIRAAAAFGLIAALLAVAEVVWIVVLLNGSSDGPAFVMTLVVLVLIPVLLASTLAVLIPAAPRRSRVVGTAAVAATGLAAAGVTAGVFVGDDPDDPAFIHWIAATPPAAFVAAVALSGIAMWQLLGSLPTSARITITAVGALAGPAVLGFALLTGTPLVLLVALGAPIALAVLAVLARRRAGPGAVPAR